MKLSTLSTLALVVPLVLALSAGQALAMPQEEDGGYPGDSMEEEQAYYGQPEEFASDEAAYDEAHTNDGAVTEADAADAGDDEGWTASSEADAASANTEAKPASQQRPSDGQRLKRGLAQMLLGVLMPAVEREVREAVDLDEASADAEVDSESGP